VAVGQSDSRGWDFAVAKYKKDGSLDSSFGDGGKLLTDFASLGHSTQTCSSENEVWPCTDDQAFAVRFQAPNGGVIAAGLGDNDFAFARYALR